MGLAMIFNNFWYTDFQGDSPGVMEFQFDLLWRKTPAVTPRDGLFVLPAGPVVLINPNLKESPGVIQNLYQP